MTTLKSKHIVVLSSGNQRRMKKMRLNGPSIMLSDVISVVNQIDEAYLAKYENGKSIFKLVRPNENFVEIACNLIELAEIWRHLRYFTKLQPDPKKIYSLKIILNGEEVNWSIDIILSIGRKQICIWSNATTNTKIENEIPTTSMITSTSAFISLI